MPTALEPASVLAFVSLVLAGLCLVLWWRSRQRRVDLQRSLDAGGVGMWRWSVADGEIELDECARSILGASVPPKISVDKAREHLHPDDRAAVLGHVESVVGDGGRLELEFRVRLAGGRVSCLALRGRCIADRRDGTVVVGAMWDRTVGRRGTEAQLSASQERARALFDASPVGVAFRRFDGMVLDANPALLGMLGYDEKQIDQVDLSTLGSPALDASMFSPPEDDPEPPSTAEILAGSFGRYEPQQKELRRADGELVPVRTTQVSVRLPDGQEGVLSVVEDITEVKRFHNRLVRLSLHDGLTNLANRVHFGDELERAVARAERRDRSLAVLFIDLDRFKMINDSYGHHGGDAVLQEVARRLKACVRAEDLMARLGGDEFGLLIDELGADHLARNVAEKILSALAAPFSVQGKEEFIGASVGIATFPDCGRSADSLLRSADLAMYGAKERGGGTFQFYSEEMQRSVVRRLELERELKDGMSEECFEVFYQPRLNLESGEIEGCEALLRWHAPGRGVVEPYEFIDVLESSGLMRQLGNWVLDQACTQLAEWRSKGYELSASVNVSAAQLQQPDFVDGVKSAVIENRLDAGALELEVTEGVFMEKTENGAAKLEELDRFGVSISIDDFGTGYSSLQYLKSLPVSLLKIATQFVQGLPADRSDEAIVRSIVSLARELGLRVVAEGIERPSQLNLLREIGCDGAQGFLLGSPMRAGDLERLLADRHAAVIGSPERFVRGRQ